MADAVRCALALAAGSAGTALLVDGDVVGFHWLPALLGLALLLGAVVGRSRGPWWAPGLVLAAVGASVGLWFQSGRSGDDYGLVPLVVLGLGLGGVLAAALDASGRARIGPMSVALPVLGFGTLALLDQQDWPLAGRAWPYAVTLAAWGALSAVRARAGGGAAGYPPQVPPP